MNNIPETINIDEWTLKIHQPEGPGPHPVFLLIHGWTGDENSMWVFGSQLSSEAIIITPRAPYLSNHPKYAGYSWNERKTGEWSSLDDFLPSIQALDDLLEKLEKQLNGDFSSISLVGFSQGTALSYGYALLHLDRIQRIAGLAGFAPENFEKKISSSPLQDIPIYIAHGTLDETVPIEKAHTAKELLIQAGAIVTYCESEVGHKLGANCFRGFKDFMAINGST